MTDLASLGRDPVRLRLADQLRAFCGQGRRYSLEGLAAAADLAPRTLKSYRDGTAEAPASVLLRLMAVLPVEFAAALLAPAGLRPAALDALDPSDFQVNGDLAAAIAGFGEALRDGRIDHRERAALRPLAHALAAALSDWADGGPAMSVQGREEGRGRQAA